MADIAKGQLAAQVAGGRATSPLDIPTCNLPLRREPAKRTVQGLVSYQRISTNAAMATHNVAAKTPYRKPRQNPAQ